MAPKVMWREFDKSEFDDRQLITLYKTKNGQALQLAYKNGTPYAVQKRILNGKPTLCVGEQPFKYSKVQPRDSNFHNEFMYYNQAIIELYPNIVNFEETEYDGFPSIVFTLPDGSQKTHVMQELTAKSGQDYRVVSIVGF